MCIDEGLWFLFWREVAGIHSLSALNSLLWRRRERERERTDNYQQAGETKCFQASDGDGTEASFRLRAGWSRSRGCDLHRQGARKVLLIISNPSLSAAVLATLPVSFWPSVSVSIFVSLVSLFCLGQCSQSVSQSQKCCSSILFFPFLFFLIAGVSRTRHTYTKKQKTRLFCWKSLGLFAGNRSIL